MTEKQTLWKDRILWAVPAGLFVLTVLYMIFFQTLETAVAFSAIDDGLYYPRVAQNIVERGMCTYDGITATNGFHPLWLVCLLPVYFLVRNPWAALWGVYGLIFLTQLGALALFWKISKKLRMSLSGWTAAVFVLLINIRSFTIFFSFLESPLVLLTLLGFLTYCLTTAKSRFSSFRGGFFAGILFGLCFLARLDTFWLPVSYALIWTFYFAKNPAAWKSRINAAVAAAGGCLLLVVPYLLWNLRVFGHIQTVSAWQKTASISPLRSWRIISGWTLHQFIPRVQHILGIEQVAPGVLMFLMMAGGLAVLLFLTTGNRRRRLMQTISVCPDFFLFVLLHLIFIALIAPQEAAASAWYWVPEIILAALVIGVALPDWQVFRVPLVLWAVLLMTGIQLWGYSAIVKRKTMSFAKLEVAEYLRRNTPPDARVAMFDSGIVSYFSQRDFVGLNGLIGDFDHAELIRSRQYAAAMARCNVKYLVLDTPAELLPKLAPYIVYTSDIRTKFENFSEPPKPFVIYTGTPVELEKIWHIRYNGQR